MAYRGANYTNDVQSSLIKEWVSDFEFGFLELPYPDLNIFFDVDIEKIEKRLSEKREGESREYLNGKSDIHEADIEYQKRVRDNYLSMHGLENYKIIKAGNLTPEQIFLTYYKDIENILNKNLNIDEKL
jgi:dTMP kinase